ncbi:hypothetical protein GLAREA_10513 [Glarea lozoyensis ATCC 20868]|uniref:Secreted protein n=1 Tax=Glarea lozoyensis (strain ATCC 20868 / MF5171) TaxID=1116229 RepID=S3E977_GLAL2|nr:uncharacterized protein GLAREA_10513 [Glarea lozoyensis ATCC 20868]EPE34818.1 hypothetical protein GLAREA_10513 [Glarea lozoyensis ATCC 20868]
MLFVAIIYATLWICSTDAGTIPTIQVDDLPWPLVSSENDYQLLSDSNPAPEGDNVGTTVARTNHGFTTLDNVNPKLEQDISRRGDQYTKYCCKDTGWSWKETKWMCGHYAASVTKEIPIIGHTCNRVACYDEAEIIVCNDELFAVRPTAADISDRIESIQKQCSFTKKDGTHVSCGQEFDPHKKYNVILRLGDKNSCKTKTKQNPCQADALWNFEALHGGS